VAELHGASQEAALSDHLLAIIQAQTDIARASQDPLTLMTLVVDHARSLTGAEGAAVGVVDGDYLKFRATSGRSVALDVEVPIEGSLSGQCLRSGELLISDDVELDPRVDKTSARVVGARSMAVAPLFDGARPVGVLNITHPSPRAFGARAVQTLQLISGLLGAALGHAEAFANRTKVEMESRALADQLTAVLSAATEFAIIGVDLEGGITFFSLGAQRMLGYRPEEVIGQRPTMFHDPAEVRLAVELAGGSMPEAFIGRALHGEAYTRDWTYIRKDGSRLTVQLTLTPMSTTDGALLGFIGVASDITTRKAVERMKDEFISVVSHELRTPLTGIRASLGLLAGGVLGDVSAQAQRMLDLAVSNTDRLIRLVSDMLDIERMQSGEATLLIVECDLDDVVHDAVEQIKPVADRARIRIDAAGTPGITLRADRDRLVQVLTNLLSNAVKFSASGTTITLSTAIEHDRIRIDVRDQGRGIPSDQLEGIFERFRQVDASDSRLKGGTGLGLAICRMIVEQHGGRIWAESTPAHGTTVSVELPTP
jgi:PAS domain S-box-containing protein